MSRTRGDALPDGWRTRFLAALAAGHAVAQASEMCGVSVAHLYRLRKVDDEFRADWEETKQVARLVRADQAWHANDQLIQNPDHRDHFSAVKLAIEKNDPDATPRIELAGNVDVTHRRGYTLADLLALAAAGNDEGPGGGARRELPAARELLAAPE